MIRHYDHQFIRDAVTNSNPTIVESKAGKMITYRDPNRQFTLIITPTTRELVITDWDYNTVRYVISYHKEYKQIKLSTIRNGIEELDNNDHFFNIFSRYGITFTPQGYDVILTIPFLMTKVAIILLCNSEENIDSIRYDLKAMSDHPVLIYSVNYNGFDLQFNGNVYEIEHLLREKYSAISHRTDDESGYIRLLINDQWKVAKGMISIGPDLDLVIRPLDSEGSGMYEIVPFGYNHQLGIITYNELDKKLHKYDPHQVRCYFSDRYDHQLVDYLKNTNRDDYVKDSINGMLNFEESEKWVFQKSIHFESFRQIK